MPRDATTASKTAIKTEPVYDDFPAYSPCEGAVADRCFSENDVPSAVWDALQAILPLAHAVAKVKNATSIKIARLPTVKPRPRNAQLDFLCHMPSTFQWRRELAVGEWSEEISFFDDPFDSCGQMAYRVVGVILLGPEPQDFPVNIVLPPSKPTAATLPSFLVIPEYFYVYGEFTTHRQEEASAQKQADVKAADQDALATQTLVAPTLSITDVVSAVMLGSELQ
ncbi:hypothetical protein HKX48_002575 [Thoreauomyces humboldtii]|nr:hypothetical protein HKX48_002575 [Thoreauomyces humboldtii]